MTSLEQGLLSTLSKTSEEVAHSECFDAEQRAEVYAILHALKANTDLHRETVSRLASKIRERQADA